MKSKWIPQRLDALKALENQVRFFSSKKMLAIAEKRFNLLIRKIRESRRRLAECESITEAERKKYLRYVNRILQRALIMQGKYGWLPYNKDANTKQLYVETFFCLRVARKVWRGIKDSIHKFIPK